jgi:diguanylate cyclase (GGDEF)-like protein
VTLSFRLRLTLFFLLIVVLPMVALAILVSQIAADSASGKADARLNAGLRTATNLYGQAQEDSRRAAARLAAEAGADPAAVAALDSGDQARIQALAQELSQRPRLDSVAVKGAAGASAEAGDPEPVAGASVDLIAADGSKLGTLSASTTTAQEFVDALQRITGEHAALVGPRGPLAAGPGAVAAADLPPGGEAADLTGGGGDSMRIQATQPLGQEQVRVALMASSSAEGFFGSQPKVAVAVIVFFAVAMAAVLLLLRSLQGYVADMLGAARRIGDGDFSRKIPITGSDEMAGLASEFNKMSDRLGEQMDQLRRQRLEIEKSVQRIGEAFASGLDREALLTILVETAVGTCEADYGLVALTGQVGAETETGRRTEAMSDAALAAEERALREERPVEEERGGAFALSSALGNIGQSGEPVGAMTIAREGKPFTSSEREVFLYLLGQAAASVENVALHELVAEQAVTDELTGLPNKRAFQEAMRKEAARAARFKHDLSLVILDVDNFKKVNDTYGHLQGDEVLRVIGKILAEESRGIDAPARYGGEEFVVALPETDTQGALEVAERIRERIEAVTIPLIEQEGELKITASIGTATMPAPPADTQDLVAAADGALYEAKRTGKNRVVVAPTEEPEAAAEAGNGSPAGSDDGAEAKGPLAGRRK